MSDQDAVGFRELLDLLNRGKLELEGQFLWGSNYTFLVRITDGERAAAGVYKPGAGERPLWDFDHASLCRREVAAFLLSTFVGWPLIPPTVLRDGPHGPGSVQLYVDAHHEEHFFSLREAGGHEREFQEIALFDVLANNADRKGGHCLLGKDGRIWAIDHGLTFHQEYKLRTVIWDYAGQTIPAALLARLGEVQAELAPGRSLWQTLLPLLLFEELQALQQRWEQLLAAGRFPLPGPGRNVPYPLV